MPDFCHEGFNCGTSGPAPTSGGGGGGARGPIYIDHLGAGGSRPVKTTTTTSAFFLTGGLEYTLPYVKVLFG